MAYYFPEGSVFSYSTTLAAAKTISALTNANPAVATSTAHGYATNDEILLTSGWEDATDSVYRITSIDANSFSVQGLNSTSTQFFPAGQGTGSAQRLSSWQTIPQVLSIATQGGDPRFATVQLLSRRNTLNIPIGFNPYTLTLTVAHDAAIAGWSSILDISRSLSKAAFRIAMGGGGTLYGYGYMSASEMPTLNAGQVNQATVTLTLIGRAVAYST